MKLCVRADMTRLLNENKGNLFVPNDFKEEATLAESAEAAALAAQVKDEKKYTKL